MNILEIKGISKFYPVKRPFKPIQYVKALNEITFNVPANKTLGIVGESGCGKSTLAKALMNIETPTAGSVLYNGKKEDQLNPKEFRSTIQMIFQDPYSSINPRKKAWQIIAEPLFINTDLSKEECLKIACEMMDKVGLRPELAHRFPHMFSGGQRQRIGIARALVLKPKILICDEPVSALDVSIQAQVLNLLVELQDELDLTYLFISHDLSVVKHISDEILVMYLGRIVEYGNREEIFNNPLHPYTRALMASSPSFKNDETNVNTDAEAIKGELPSPFNPPSGCAFHKRCPLATDECSKVVPTLETKSNRLVACHQV
jgi:dipeptide transport system ATP-binding protein